MPRDSVPTPNRLREISPSLVYTVTDTILYLGALHVKVKTYGRVANKTIYLAFGVNLQSLKDVLEMWTVEAEGANFWMQVVTELKNQGTTD